MLINSRSVVGDAVALALSELKKFTRADSAYIIQEVRSVLKQTHNFRIKTVTGHAIFWGGVH